MKNKKGFTLVELLAVIVVLAIIMIIAIPSVLSAMDNAKKSSFVVEGRKVLNQAMTTIQSNALSGGNTSGKFSLTDLGIEAGGKYYGCVEVTGNDYKLYLYDGTFHVEDVSSSDLNNLDNVYSTALTDGQTTESYTGCTATKTSTSR